MTPGARVQAAIEILDAVIAAAREAGPPADRIVADYFRARRYAGSKDRRAVRELVFDVIRKIGKRPDEGGRAALLGGRPDLAEMFGGDGYAPTALVEGEPRAEPALAPPWLAKKLGKRLHPAMLERAPIDLRINRLRVEPDTVPHLGSPIEGLENGLRGAPSDIADRPEFRDGWVEVQDAGSQRIVQIAAASPGQTVLDLCAGAGGKALGLASDMRDSGRLIAADTDRRRLGELPPRAARAGASIIETRLLNPGQEAEALEDLRGACDLVLVDAPCSGTGTWRRNPEARWRITPQRLRKLTALQAELIALGSDFVAPGGALVYAVCSLLPDEGDAIANGFSHPAFVEKERTLLSPQQDGTDGFFIVRFERV